MAIASTWTVDELVSRVRRAAQLTTDNTKLSTQNIVDIADEEIQAALFPMLRSTSEDYSTTTISLTAPYYATASDPLDQCGRVVVPARAASSTISAVHYINASNQWVSISHVDTTTAHRIRSRDTAEYPTCYSLQSNSIIIAPKPTANVSLRVTYENRPSRLVLLSNAASLSSTGATDTFSTTESANVYGSTAGSLYDIVSSYPQLGPLAIDLNIETTVVGPPEQIRVYVTTGGDLATTGIAGLNPTGTTTSKARSPMAYLCRAGQTCVFPMPDAWWNVAIDQTAMRVCREIGDNAGEAAIAPTLEQRKAQLVELAGNRVRKQPRIITGRDLSIVGGWCKW